MPYHFAESLGSSNIPWLAVSRGFGTSGQSVVKVMAIWQGACCDIHRSCLTTRMASSAVGTMMI